MDGALYVSDPERELIRTGPIELRDVGPNGRKLGTPDDCYEDSPWELHRGELVEKPVSNDIHSLAIIFSGTLFRNHARDDYSVMSDVYCVLDDERGASRRAPDTVLVKQVVNPKGDPYRGIPILAVEIRATQSKKNLDEKVVLYLEHDWPTVWLVHTERREVEVVKKGLASVVYRIGTHVPLVPELDKYGLTSVPVSAFFDHAEGLEYTAGWVHAHGRASGFVDGRASGFVDGHASGVVDGRIHERAGALLDLLGARGFVVTPHVRERVLSCGDLDQLQRWFLLAATVTNLDAFVAGLG